MFESKLKLPDDIEFIAGSTQTLEFTIYDRNDDLLDLRGASITWYLSEIGNNENPLIEKTGVDVSVPSDGIISVKINPIDTVSLTNGKYEHEISVTQQNGRVLKPCYGYIKIKDCAR